MDGRMTQGMDFALLNHDADLLMAVVRMTRKMSLHSGAGSAGEHSPRLRRRVVSPETPAARVGK